MASNTTVRKSKEITKKEDLDLLLNITADDITQSFVFNIFGNYGNGARFNPYDLITIPPNIYGNEKKNKKAFNTNVGRWIFNKAFIEPAKSIFDMVGYFNETITKKSYGKLDEKLTYWLLEDKITVDDYKYFINMTQLFMPFITILSPGFTEKMLTCSKKINKEKQRLLKENKAQIDAGNLSVIDDIQKQLLDYAREILKDDPSMDMFTSGAFGSFDNNFKNMFVMRGTARDPDPDKGYNVITSNYIDGISADEYAAFANTLAEGPYNRSKKTEVIAA